MSRYEGLNLPQLLELMHELVMPEPVPWIPETPGWWIVAGWLIAVATICAWKFVEHRRRNRYRREALAELRAIESRPPPNSAEMAQRIAALIKRTALVAYPRREVAALYGTDWAKFLADSAQHDPRITDAASLLAAAAYRPDADGKALCEPARRWIRLHRA